MNSRREGNLAQRAPFVLSVLSQLSQPAERARVYVFVDMCETEEHAPAAREG